MVYDVVINDVQTDLTIIFRNKALNAIDVEISTKLVIPLILQLHSTAEFQVAELSAAAADVV